MKRQFLLFIQFHLSIYIFSFLKDIFVKFIFFKVMLTSLLIIFVDYFLFIHKSEILCFFIFRSLLFLVWNIKILIFRESIMKERRWLCKYRILFFFSMRNGFFQKLFSEFRIVHNVWLLKKIKSYCWVFSDNIKEVDL